MKSKIFLSLCLIFAIPALIYSQSDGSYYTVQVGTFLDAKAGDFEPLSGLGFLHVNKMGGNQTQVFVGGFNKRSDADQVLTQVRKKGYSNAFIQERLLDDGETVTVIQLGIRSIKKDIDWERYFKAGQLYVLLKGSEVKIVTGIYSGIDQAKQALPAIRKAGFSDAFVKRVNSVFLHEVGTFEADGEKRPLIPLDFKENTASSGKVPANVPGGYDYVAQKSGTSSASRPTVPVSYGTESSLPKIRGKVKRRSVVELQKVLKSEGTYKSSLDGYYGNGTSSAYEATFNNNREIQKYSVLSNYLNRPGLDGATSELQQAIDNLLDDPNAPAVLDRYSSPVAKGYQAYLLYTAIGANSEVNALMNAAIKEAYSDKKLQNQPPFNYKATYAYQDLEQLILHLHYIHSAPGNTVAVPCWLFQVHPKETAEAYRYYTNVSNNNFQLQSCDEFLFWDEIRTMQAIATDLNGDHKLDKSKLAGAASDRAQLYLSPKALNGLEEKKLNDWNRNLWNGLNGWAARDPMHERIVTAFKLTYYQSQVRLEDFFMDKGFKKDEAEGLALATLKSLVGYHLERFV